MNVFFFKLISNELRTDCSYYGRTYYKGKAIFRRLEIVVGRLKPPVADRKSRRKLRRRGAVFPTVFDESRRSYFRRLPTASDEFRPFSKAVGIRWKKMTRKPSEAVGN